MERIELHIFGRVQGVLFRQAARRHAEKLGLTGWIRNENDGSVHAVAEGGSAELEQFLDWCRSGPPLARVDRIAVEKREATGEFSDFRIL